MDNWIGCPKSQNTVSFFLLKFKPQGSFTLERSRAECS